MEEHVILCFNDMTMKKKDGRMESIEEAIKTIKTLGQSKADLLGKDLHYRLTEWRRDEYLKTWKCIQ